MAPRGPHAIVNRLQAIFTAALNAPDAREPILRQGFEIVGSTPREFASYIKAEIPKWAKVLKNVS